MGEQTGIDNEPAASGLIFPAHDGKETHTVAACGGMPVKHEALGRRGPENAHPFLLNGPDSHRRFVATVSECSQAQMAGADG